MASNPAYRPFEFPSDGAILRGRLLQAAFLTRTLRATPGTGVPADRAAGS